MMDEQESNVMNENAREKSLVKTNNKSMFYKIKSFFIKMFLKNDNMPIQAIEERNNTKNEFLDNIKNTENEETVLLKLQKRYRLGEVREKDLTSEQVDSLCKLYDKQIAELKKSNDLRKQKLLEYRRNLQTE